MFNSRSRLIKFITTISVFIIILAINTFISFITAATVLTQLLSAGCNKYVSMGAALLIVVGVNRYIVHHHEIWNFINKTRDQNNE